jgi:hypothetical protein
VVAARAIRAKSGIYRADTEYRVAIDAVRAVLALTSVEPAAKMALIDSCIATTKAPV